MSEQFTNPEQELIERLRRAPQPELSAEVREAILGRVLEAFENPPVPVSASRPRFLNPAVVIVLVVIIGVLIAGGILLVLSQRNQTPQTPTATIQPSLTVTPTSEPTSTLTATAIPPTAVTAVVASLVPTETVTPTLIPTLQLTNSPAPVATSSIGMIIVIEGPVEKIDGNVITIYGLPIQIAPGDPILTTVTIGDNLRVEGNQIGTGQVTIIAITVVNVNVIVGGSTNGGNTNSGQPPSGEVWTDDGSCAHAPPDWAPANGWRRRCQGQDKEKDKGNKDDKGKGKDD